MTARTTIAQETAPYPGYPFANVADPANQDALFRGFNEISAALDKVDDFEAISTDAQNVSVTCWLTELTAASALTGTLPDGAKRGQRKRIVMLSGSATNTYTLTITTPETATGLVASATWVFDTPGQSVEFVWSGTKWRVYRVARAGSKAVVVGTTVLTGYCLTQTYSLSVTGTAHSTATKGIPNGNFPGETIHVTTPTAASTPLGDIAITATTIATGAAATSLAAINATTAQASFVWDGSTWQNISLTTATLS